MKFLILFDLNLDKKSIIKSLTFAFIAYKSTYGFQSESYNTTVSAVAKLIPNPPTLVNNKNIKYSNPS